MVIWIARIVTSIIKIMTRVARIATRLVRVGCCFSIKEKKGKTIILDKTKIRNM